MVEMKDEDNIHKLSNGYEVRVARKGKFLFVLLIYGNQVQIIDSIIQAKNQVTYGRVFFDSPKFFYWAQEYKPFQPIVGKIVFKTAVLSQLENICFLDAERKKNQLVFTNANVQKPKYFYLFSENHIDTFETNGKVLDLRYYRIDRVEKNKIRLEYVETDDSIFIEMPKKRK